MREPTSTVIKVIGLGGGGSNAVNRMIELGLEGAEFIAANTDSQALAQSLAPVRLQLGPQVTRGLGAGGDPAIGEKAAEESRAAIQEALAGADLVFLAAGMGGGTGTGAIAVAAEIARAVGALTVGVVTLPFSFEATRRQRNAERGLTRLRPYVDTLITVPNDKLLPLVGRDTPFDLALRVADEVLRQGVQGIAEMVGRAGLINVDFAHVRTLLKLPGRAALAIGQGRGETMARDAIRQALQMPLVDMDTLADAAGLLVHFTGGEDLALHAVADAVDEINRAAPQAEVVFGVTIDPLMNGRAQVIMVGTGLGEPAVDTDAAADIVASTAPATLAEALFRQIHLPANPLERHWVVPDEESRSAAACLADNLDIPAFLRRRQRLRDLGKQ